MGGILVQPSWRLFLAILLRNEETFAQSFYYERLTPFNKRLIHKTLNHGLKTFFENLVCFVRCQIAILNQTSVLQSLDFEKAISEPEFIDLLNKVFKIVAKSKVHSPSEDTMTHAKPYLRLCRRLSLIVSHSDTNLWFSRREADLK